MRNLKKLTALVLALAMVITLFMVPVVAEELTAAQKLTVLGVLKGSGDGVTEEYLAGAAKRSTAAILYLKLKGLEDEAKNFDGVENFDDAEGQSQYVKNIMAYYKANPELGFQGYNNKFNPDAVISAQEYYKVMLTALGYEQGVDFEWSEVLTFAKFVGLKLISNVTEMTVDNFAVATTEALDIEVKGTGATMIETLVADGTVADTDAAAAGWEELAEPVVVELAAIEDIAVANGGAVPTLPETVAATYDNDETADLVVTWNEDDVAAIDTTVGGTYTVEGVFAETDMTATVDVVVAADTTVPTADSATFTNSKTLTVALSEAVEGTPAIKINGTDEPAANVALAEDGKSIVITRTTDFAVMSYLINVGAGLADAAGNAVADTNLTATRAAAVATSVQITTTGLPDNAKQAVATVSYDVYDQYGAKMTTVPASAIKLSFTYNGMPLAENLNALNTFTTTINSASVLKDRNIVVTAYTKDSNNKYTVAAGTATLPVLDEAAKATAVSEIEIDSVNAGAVTDIKAGDAFVLEATVLDQFNNLYNGVVASLRWVVDGLEVAQFTGNTTVTFEDELATPATEDFTAVGAGTVAVNAYLLDGTAVGSLNVVVGNGTVAAVTKTQPVGGLAIVNKAAVADANVTINGAGTTNFDITNAKAAKIPVMASDVTITVTTGAGATADNSAADVTVEKVTDDNGYLTGLKISSARTNSSVATVNYNVKLETNNISDTITVKTDIDTAVASISDISFATNEVTNNATVTKAISFYNQYGEALSIDDANVTVTTSAGTLAVTKQETDGAGGYQNVDNALTDDIIGLKFAPTAAGSFSVLVTSGVASKSYAVTVAAQSKVSAVSMATNLTAIKDDKYDTTTASIADNIYEAGNLAYVVTPISFTNQYGNAIDVLTGSLDFDPTNATNAQAIFLDKNGADADPIAGGSGLPVKYIAVRTVAAAAAYEAPVVRVLAAATASGNNLDTPIGVTALAAPKVKTLSLSKSAASFVDGSTTIVEVTALDQYGRDITKYAGYANGAYFVAAPVISDATVINTAVLGNNATTGAVELTINAKSKIGTSDVTVAILGAEQDANYVGDQKVACAVKNNSAIASVEITNDVDANGYYEYPLDDSAVTGGIADTLTVSYKVTLDDGTEVTLAPNSSLLVWSVSNAAILPTGTAANKFDTTGGANDADVTVTLTSVNGKQDTLLVNLDKDAPALVASTLAIASSADSDATVDGIQLTKSTANISTLTVSAKDKYNNVLAPAPAVSAWASSDPAKATITAGGVVTTAAETGTVTFTAIVSGNVVQLTVTVVD